MLIITADDYGKVRKATDNIIKCFLDKRIMSASAMVFMEDSERAASLAFGTDLEVGLHLNFTLPFTSSDIPPNLREHQKRILSYLANHKLSQVIYNPFLTSSFNFVFKSQLEEFSRLYGRIPEFYNGHHHMHLCTNMLASKMLPNGTRIRRTFAFDAGEKDLLNRLYRFILNVYISKKFISTDYFYSIAPVQNYERIRNFINRANNEAVEIEVHPEDDEETEYLHGDIYKNLVYSIPLGCFRDLLKKYPLRS